MGLATVGGLDSTLSFLPAYTKAAIARMETGSAIVTSI